MELIELDQDNLEYYEDYMEPDAAENIGRECCTGLVLMDGYEGETVAALLLEKRPWVQMRRAMRSYPSSALRTEKTGRKSSMPIVIRPQVR